MDHQVATGVFEASGDLPGAGATRAAENPERSLTRAVLRAIDHEALAANGLRVTWAVKDYPDETMFQVALWYGGDSLCDQRYQIFLRVPCENSTAAEVADRVTAVLSTPPPTWPVTYRCWPGERTTPPPMAGDAWSPERA